MYRKCRATLKLGNQSWPLSGWWQEITVPNAEHQNLVIEVDAPISRRIQIQKWEN